jgi:hypothetical protein
MALAAAGCKSAALGPYVSPRVIGRVVASDSLQPLAGVTVVRGPLEPPPAIGTQPKGGELLMRKAPAKTGPDGRFVLPAERLLSLVRWGGWDSVRLNLELQGYQRCDTNIPTSSLTSTNAPDGTPCLDTGDLRLVPRKK